MSWSEVADLNRKVGGVGVEKWGIPENFKWNPRKLERIPV